MYYLIYTSYAVNPFTEQDLEALLQQSREDNAKYQITGMLFYYNQSFMQLIEGDEIEVKTLYQKIENDPRHNFVLITKEGPITNRFFTDWSMGYKTLDNAEIQQLEQTGEPAKPGVVNKDAAMRLFEISAGW